MAGLGSNMTPAGRFSNRSVLSVGSGIWDYWLVGSGYVLAGRVYWLGGRSICSGPPARIVGWHAEVIWKAIGNERRRNWPRVNKKLATLEEEIGNA